MNNRTISVCIPSYNRSQYLREVLDSVVSQSDLHEVVICEDRSPEQAAIRQIVCEYQEKYPGLIVYHENKVNLGFDGNIRQLLRVATGDYCLFLGNDDLLADGAVHAISVAIASNPGCGVLLRAYGWFEGDASNMTGCVRYFKEGVTLSPGPAAMRFGYRRSCVLAGLTVLRKPTLDFECTDFDGTLYYQMYVVGRLLVDHSCVYVPDLIALCRADERPQFGNAAAERGEFTPGEYTVKARLKMMAGMVKIARHLDLYSPQVSHALLGDIANYSLPWISYHADKPFPVFFNYYRGLSRLGLGRYPMFHIYFALVTVFGKSCLDALVLRLRRVLGATPRLKI
ncbi:MAG: glycosyltransferase family 2 protein [Rhodocyclaceae bacterium]